MWYILSQFVANLRHKCTANAFKIGKILNRGIMAAAPDGLEEILSCQVCFEEFTEDGAHVPRLLPCTHTLCHTCIGQLIQGTRIECPECRMKHEAKKEEKSFPQNKYILVQMKRRTPKVEHAQPEKCSEHGKDLNIFCKEPGCQRIICLVCLSHDHKKHDFVEIEERKKEVMDTLQKNYKAVTDNLQRKIRNIMSVKQDAARKIEKNIEELNMKKEDMKKQYEKMIQEAKDHLEEITVKTDQELNAMKETLNLIHDMNKSAEAIKDDTYRDIMNKVETMSGIIENVNKHQTGKRTYEYHEYTTDIETHIAKKKILVEIKEEIADRNLKTNPLSDDGMMKYTQNMIKPAKLQGKMKTRNS